MKSAELINSLIKELSEKGVCKTDDISDGYHNFCDLYKHRCLLFAHLCKVLHESGKAEVWRSLKNSDGETWRGWFIMGIHKEKGKQITYHLPYEYWDHTAFAETLEKGFWDGHTSDDVIQRLILDL